MYSIESVTQDFNLFLVMPLKIIHMDSKDTVLEATEGCNVVVIEYLEEDTMKFLLKLTPQVYGSRADTGGGLRCYSPPALNIGLFYYVVAPPPQPQA